MKYKQILIILYFLGLIWSCILPRDYFTLFLEIFPAVLGLIVLLITAKKFTFTNLTYSFILFHCYVLFVGGHYTYAEVPAFNWLKEFFHQSRNNYDKVGHFTQGFVPAMIIRELFIRQEIVKRGKWLPFLTVCVCLSISAGYEFLEWFVAVATGDSADSFLGTQGYVWDTQSDMLYATIGAISMTVFLAKVQNQEIEKLKVAV